MKQFFLLFLCTAIVFAGGDKKEKQPCCAPTATAEFAAFGKELAFAALHESPEPFFYQSVNGQEKNIAAADGKEVRIYEVRSAVPTNNVLFVFQEWWGLNDYIKQEAEKLHREVGNVHVIALDLYDGKIAETADSARKYIGETDETRIRTIITAAQTYVGKKAKIATIGWCFGGGWSLQASLMLGKQAAGCVIYYGMPEKDVKKLRTLQCDVLGIFATQDSHISPAVVAEFEKNMAAAKKKLTVKNYDAVHAFANPSNPNHNKSMTADANVAVVAFLRTKLGIK